MLARHRVLLVAIGACCTGLAVAAPGPFESLNVPAGQTVRVSEHVHVIEGFPNVVFVVGKRAALVIDTGLGPANGAVVLREVTKLAKGLKLYLTTTHYHVEHTSGAQAFAADTVLIRAAVQEKELEIHGEGQIGRFRRISPQHDSLLHDAKLRQAEIVFDREVTLHLGEVTARLAWLGPAHTKGDQVIFVPEDSVLISGDLVQEKLAPLVRDADASIRGWIAALDVLERLAPTITLPDHGAWGSGAMIARQRAFLIDLQSRALARRKEGKPVEEAAALITGELKQAYPDWEFLDAYQAVPSAVAVVYSEAQ
jgi:glyoxylase-like metal-dependent hydrolase (beta-lactamase superfamily II)